MKLHVGFLIVGAFVAGLMCCPTTLGQGIGPTPEGNRTELEQRYKPDANYTREMNFPDRTRDPWNLYDPLSRRRSSIPAPPPRKMTEEHKRLLYPSDEEKQRFEAFLNMPRTGLIRMLPESDCRDDPRVIKVGSSCLDAIPPVPGGGSAYSFSSKTYAGAELRLRGNVFHAGLITSLGDVPLENLTLQSPGVDNLSNLTPTDAKEVFQAGGYTYSAGVQVHENTTFAMRSHAYPTSKGLRWIDVLVVFRVVSKAPDGSVTLLWKELEREKRPKLKSVGQTAIKTKAAKP